VVTPARRDRHREGQVIFAHSRLGRRRRLAWRARRAPASGACSGHERHAAVCCERTLTAAIRPRRRPLWRPDAPLARSFLRRRAAAQQQRILFACPPELVWS
jgi:hypothetical protein